MQQASFAQLLEIENDPAFLTFRSSVEGTLLWPLIRNQFYRLLISGLYYQSAPLVAEVPSVPRRQALVSLGQVVRHNLRHRAQQGDVLVMATGAGSFLRDGKWFNRITDYLVEASPANTVTIEGLMDWHVPQQRWNQRLSYWLPWQGAISLSGRVLQRKRHLHQAREIVEYAGLRAIQLLDLHIGDRDKDMLVGMLARKIARLPIMLYAYRRLFERVRPRLLMMEQACYGDFSPINQVAHEMGIRVAEPQHGMVSVGHDAYCYAPLLRDSQAFRACLPHDFLAYGAWWTEQINVPVNKWVIGHPHYTEQRQGMLNPQAQEQNDILLLSDGIEFSIYLALATELAALLKGRYRVVLRPHPLERARIGLQYPGGRVGDVCIDGNRDIYSSFVTARAVAGEVSTGLFEAIGVAGQVMLWETPKARFSYPEHPFSGFANAREFVDTLHSSDRSVSVVEEDLWASGWRDNYNGYLRQVLDESV
ncbi:hypothetical protein [Pseudomonas sichuanensis]|uniref:hypothetical protein n=1 Tax=Pseudomonas sichuanensis TaxID=2213015 RepID=UPI002160172A|nr:hypothetical protein [Pseudomonas sichuanensis]MDZ4017819.1 hypothetical protein [Pseudomonas sichuanensis]UVL90717.1 hypothetical protein LOY51_07435 [Pseudomonas sichuanensis]